MKELIEKWKELLKQKEKMILLILSGILILIICMPTEQKRKTELDSHQTVAGECNQQSADYIELYRRNMEDELEHILENVEGMGKVQVMITLKSTGEKILARNEPYNLSNTEESDAEGGKRSIEEKSVEEEIIYGQTASGDEQPYIIKEFQPEISGVFIVAEGGNQEIMQLQITEAVQALFDIDAHKIRIVKRKS